MKLIFEMGAPGRRGFILPPLDVPEKEISSVIGTGNLRGSPPDLPEVGEVETVRHYTALSRMNFGVDSGFYPLGSCTMKYNPKVNEAAAVLPGFADLHPMSGPEKSQGALRVMYELERMLCTICGMDAFTLQPAAGAHGELTGLMLMKAWFEHIGQSGRRIMLIPDSAHGTNPASAVMAGFTVTQIPSGGDGLVDMSALAEAAEKAGDKLAGIMLTNPNTLGLFERDILKMAELIHGAGGLLYYDGANLNAIMGKASPGKMGFDVVHVNLHKTFSTPHGGGGPGSGPVGVCARLTPFLPLPGVKKDGDRYDFDYSGKHSIGRVKGFYGNFGVFLKAYAYILTLGGAGLCEVSETAVLHANWLMEKLKDAYDLPYPGVCMHEFVLSAQSIRDSRGITASDIAKGLIDRGFHPPTVYFPLIVREALMVEPTETETPETLEAFARAMLDLVVSDGSLKDAPVTTPVGRPDELRAAKTPVLIYKNLCS